MSRQVRELPNPTTDQGESDISSVFGRYDQALEIRLMAMRALLQRVRPGSDAEALHALRAAFPGSSLAERVSVLSGEAD
jgi:hypothetical protein